MWRHLISISEMAKLHGLSRQTLIHYDTIGLFKPIAVDEKGYRYYSRRQIPFLREICFLKSLGISLKDITNHLQARNPAQEKLLLEQQKRNIMAEIARLNYLREAINQRLLLYEEAADAKTMEMGEPFIKHIERRRVVFQPFEEGIDREQLHITLMKLWREVFRHEFLPARGFGALLLEEAVKEKNYLKGAGSCIFVPTETTDLPLQYVDLPSGLYVCLYKYGMPYDTTHVEYLLQWMDREGWEINGIIVDTCLLDTTFYSIDKTKDFCLLQIPVRRKGEKKDKKR